MRIPETHYAESGGIMIAYQVHGDGVHDLAVIDADAVVGAE